MFKRIFLFLVLNFVIVISLSAIIQLLGIGPYMTQKGLDPIALALFCLIWGMGGAVISLLLSKQMAKWIMHIRIIDPQTHHAEERAILEDVYMLARKAGLSKMPQVGLFQDDRMNAFATGATRNSSLVALSSGLLRKMDREQIRAVIGHEISHIANGDMVTMTLLQGVINAFVLFLARILAYAIANMGQRNKNGSSSYLSYTLLTILFEVVFMILGSMIVAAFSRYREFKADAGSSRIYNKEAMIAALERLQKEQANIQPHQEEPKAIAALMITEGKSPSAMRRIGALFASHPPLEERIAALRK